MEDSKLVKLVKQHDCIYNKSNKDFKSVSKKKAAWRSIAREIGVHEQECIRRWTNLRERFTKENRRVSALANNGMTTSNLWPLYNELTFLKSHIIPRVKHQKWTFTAEGKEPQMEYIEESTPEAQECAHEYECLIEPFQFTSSTSILSEPDTLEEEVDVFIPNDNDKRQSPTFKSEIQSLKSYHAHQDNNMKQKYEPNASRDLHAALEMIKQDYDQLRSRHRNPAVQGFGQMIVETISGMSERKQAIAMQRVTELVMNIKLDPES